MRLELHTGQYPLTLLAGSRSHTAHIHRAHTPHRDHESTVATHHISRNAAPLARRHGGGAPDSDETPGLMYLGWEVDVGGRLGGVG